MFINLFAGWLGRLWPKQIVWHTSTCTVISCNFFSHIMTKTNLNPPPASSSPTQGSPHMWRTTTPSEWFYFSREAWILPDCPGQVNQSPPQLEKNPWGNPATINPTNHILAQLSPQKSSRPIISWINSHKTRNSYFLLQRPFSHKYKNWRL